MSVKRLRERLANSGVPVANAAVAVIFAPANSSEMLFIKRPKSAADPWSGHIALPGGRSESNDISAVQTVNREVREEVGIDLENKAVLFGSLPPLAPGNVPSIFVAPFVFQLKEKTEIVHSREVESYFWAPLESLEKRVAEVELGNRTRVSRLAYIYGENVIWGLTARILDELLEALG